MMDLAQVRRRLDEERRTIAQDGHVIAVLPPVTRLRIGTAHIIRYSSLNADNADETIAREIEHHRRLSVPFEWKLYAHDTPPDLLDRLCRHGLTPGPREAVLIYDLSALPAWASDTNGCTVIRIDRIDQIADFRRVSEEDSEQPDEQDDLIASELAAAVAAGSTQHRGYVAYAGPEPVSVGRLHTHPDSLFAGLYGGHTRKACRGRGFYRALVAARAKDAIDLGARYLLVDALPTSRPILERLGFQWLTDTWPCEWGP